jgi:hypothetical protein
MVMEVRRLASSWGSIFNRREHVLGDLSIILLAAKPNDLVGGQRFCRARAIA